jgi:hypothetical protein
MLNRIVVREIVEKDCIVCQKVANIVSFGLSHFVRSFVRKFFLPCVAAPTSRRVTFNWKKEVLSPVGDFMLLHFPPTLGSSHSRLSIGFIISQYPTMKFVYQSIQRINLHNNKL